MNLCMLIFHRLVKPVFFRNMLIFSSILQICIFRSISLNNINLLNFYTSQRHFEFELSNFMEWTTINTIFISRFHVFIDKNWMLSYFSLLFILVIKLILKGIEIEIHFILKRELSFWIKLLGWCCLSMLHFFKISSQWVRIVIIRAFDVSIENMRNLVMAFFDILFNRIFIFLKNIVFVQIMILYLFFIFLDIFSLITLNNFFL